jgi:hypothetical protein
MLDSGPASGADLVPVLDEDASVVVIPGTGVPDRGEPEASDAVGAVGRPNGSAECCRFNYHCVNIGHDASMSSHVP